MNLDEIISRVRQHPRLVIADDYEVAIQERRSESAHFLNGERKNSTSENRVWIGLRIFHRKRSGRSATESFSEDAIASLVDQAFQSAEYSTVDPWFRFPFWRQPKLAMDKPFQPAKLEPLYSLIQTPPEQVQESYADESTRSWIARKSERSHISDIVHLTRLKWNVGPHGFSDSRAFVPTGNFQAAREKWFEQLLTSYFAFDGALRLGDAEEAPVMLGAKVVAECLQRLAPHFCAGGILKPGEKLVSDLITLVDDGLDPLCPAFDMEGVACQKTVLTEGGTLKTLLHDTQTAARENRGSTGSLHLAPGATVPRISTSHLKIEASAALPVPQLLAAMGDGICLLETQSWEEEGGPLQGTLVCAGWRVAQGRCVEPVRGVRLPVDLRTLFQAVVSVGSDATPFDRCTVPSILLGKMPLRG